MISGAGAIVLSSFLRRHAVEWREWIAGYVCYPEVSKAIYEAVETIDQAADEHRRTIERAQAVMPELAQAVPDYLSVAEVAARLGVSKQRIRQRLAEGTLAGVRVGRPWRVECAGIERMKG